MTTQADLEQHVSTPVPTGNDEFGAPSRSQARQALRRFVRKPSAMIALVIFVIMIVGAYVAPIFYRWGGTQTDNRKNANGQYIALSKPPGTLGHVLGTDENRFDLLARIFLGTQRDFVIMVISTGLAVVVGTLLGAVAGYFSSLVDNLLMRFVDIMLSIPALVILIVVSNRYQGLSRHPEGLAVLLGVFGWMGLARLVRAQFLALKEREFVEAAHAMGAGSARIIFRHLIPNCLSTILVFGTLSAAVSIIVETSLTYLGYGVQPPDTSLGLLISRGVDAADTRPWLFYYPGIVILVLVLCVNLIGEGIRTSFDPRNNRVRD